MKIDFEGQIRELDNDHVSVQQGLALHYEHGMTLADWYSGISKMDARSFHFSYWLMLQQNGVVKPLKGLDFNLVEFMSAYLDAVKAEADEEGEPDPTQELSSPTGSAASPEPSTRKATTRQASSGG